MGRLKWRLERVIKDAISRYRHKDALRIEDTLHNRLQELLARHQPVITVKLHRFKWVGRDCMACGGAALSPR